MKEQEPKLTVERERLYAERRSIATMSETTPEVRPQIILPENVSLENMPLVEPGETRRIPESPEGRKHPARAEKGGILESIPNASELAQRAIDGQSDNEQIFGVMAIELEAHTQIQPVKEWSDRQRALEYEEWEDLSKRLRKKKRKGGTDYSNMLRTVSGVKEALLEGLPRERRAQIIEKDARNELLAQPRRKLVNADKIKTDWEGGREIRKEFIALIDRISTGKLATPTEIRDLRRKWKELQAQYGQEAGSKDKQSLRALEVVEKHISSLNKSIIAGREQMPEARRPLTQAHAESTTSVDEAKEEARRSSAREREKARERGEGVPERIRKQLAGMKDDDERRAFLEDQGISTAKIEELLDVKKQESREDIERRRRRESSSMEPEDYSKMVREKSGRSHEETIAMAEEYNRSYKAESEASAKEAGSEELAEARKEARDIWRQQKADMARLVDERDEEGKVIQRGIYHQLGEDVMKADWGKYKWENKHKTAIVKQLTQKASMRGDGAFILKALLISGRTGQEAVTFVEEATKNRPFFQREFLEHFPHDEQVWRAFGESEAFYQHNREKYEQADVKDIEDFGWQVGHFLQNEGFGEEGATPSWERKVNWLDEEGNRVTMDGFLLDLEGNIKLGKHGERLQGKGTIRFDVHENVRLENLLEFYRNRANWLQYKGENEKYDFFREIELAGKKGYANGKLISWLDDKTRVFRGNEKEVVPKYILKSVEKNHRITENRLSDRTEKEDYIEFADILEAEAYIATVVRPMNLSYIENYASEDELPKALKNLLEKSHMTKRMWGGKPLWQFLALLPEKYTSMKDLDGVLGGTILKNYLGFYYLSDFEKLEELFGQQKGDGSYDMSKSKLFNFDGLREIRNKQVDRNNKTYTKVDYNSYFDFGYKFRGEENGAIRDAAGNTYTKEDNGEIRDGKGNIIIADNGDIKNHELAGRIIVGLKNKKMDGAFKVYTDAHGQVRTKIKSRDGFIKLINYFPEFTTNPNMRGIIQEAIGEDASMSGGKKLSATNKEYANNMATYLLRFTGAAARNEVAIGGDYPPMADALSRLIHYGEGRDKYINAGKKGEGKAGKFGNPETISQFKSILTEPMLAITTLALNEKGYRIPILKVFEELSGIRDEIGRARTDGERNKAQERYTRTASNKLQFDDQAERHYFDNSLLRALRINAKIKGGEEIKLESYGAWAPEIGYHFKSAEFQKDMTGFMQDIRYEKKSGRDLDYAMTARFWDRNIKAWRTMSIAEGQNGEQMVKIPEFMTNGKIDPEKIQKNSYLLYQQFFLTFIAGEFIHSRKMDKMATGTRHEMAYYRDVLDALSKLPGNFLMDESNMRKNKVDKPFLSKARKRWLQKVTGTSYGSLFVKSLIKSFLLGKPAKKEEAVLGGLGESFGLLLSSIFR